MSVSTATETINTDLSNSFFSTNPKEFVQCMTFNFKMLMAFSLTLLLLFVFTSCLNSIFASQDDAIDYKPLILMCKCESGKCKCVNNYNNRTIEKFSNDELYSFKTSPRSNYQSIPLNDNDNLMFGQANRYVYYADDKLVYRLEIFSNLYVLDGNIYDKLPKEEIRQKYSVFLQNANDNLYLGDLKKDGDGIYKLKYISQDKVNQLVGYNKVNVVYTKDSKMDVILSGQFH